MPDTEHDLDWTKPIMRAGYAGRAIVYLAVAGLSLSAISSGGQASGTSSIFKQLESSTWGTLVLILIFLGMLAYAVWRYIDAAYDLEDYGTDGEGTVARLGMVTTGTIHLAIGVLAFSMVFAGGGSGGGGDGSMIARITSWIMQLPGGRVIVGLIGLATLGAGLYYIKKGWSEDYRDNLRANRFTTNWNFALKIGVISQGIIVSIIGCLFVYAAFAVNPDEAGGVGKAFEWLREQPYGRILVAAICVGLLNFALFCFVNAMHRIIPKLSGDGVETLGAALKQKAKQKAPG